MNNWPVKIRFYSIMKCNACDVKCLNKVMTNTFLMYSVYIRFILKGHSQKRKCRCCAHLRGMCEYDFGRWQSTVSELVDFIRVLMFHGM